MTVCNKKEDKDMLKDIARIVFVAIVILLVVMLIASESS